METADAAPEVPGWQVVRELGRGGSSTVWLVADAEGREAALKLPARGAGDPADLLDVEVRAIGELAHEHVVRPLGVVATDRGPGLLSEYHPGGSLGALVRAAGPLPLGQVVTVLVPVAQALQALHDHGVVHGDLSPGNVLFTVRGRPAVADLGSSRLLGGPSARTGTPGFSAPELEGPRPGTDGPAGGLSPAADVYSLAAVGWYALTGRAPGRTASRAPLPLIVPDIPAEVVMLLEAGLDEEPGARPRADRFARACYRWAPAEPVDLHPSAGPEVAMELPTRRRPERPARSRRRPVLVTAGAGLAVALAAGGVALAGGPAPSSPGERPAPSPVAVPPVAPESVPPVSEPPPRRAGSLGTEPSPGGASSPGVTGSPGSAAPPDEAPGLGAEEPATAATALGAARTEALTSLDVRDVDAYSLPGSPAHHGDLRLLEDLRGRGLRYRGLDLATSVTGPVERPSPDRARVPLELTIGPHRTVTTDGQAVAEATASTTERFTAEMARTPGGWRVERILPARDAEGRPAGDPAGRPSGPRGEASAARGQE